MVFGKAIEVVMCSEVESIEDSITYSCTLNDNISLGGEGPELIRLWKKFRRFNEMEALGIRISTDPVSPLERQEQTRMKKIVRLFPNGH